MSKRQRTTRRAFLSRGVRASAGLLGAPLVVPACMLGRGGAAGPNDEIRIGVIGMGARGKNLIGNVPPPGRVVSICDCARSRLDEVFEPTGKYVDILTPFIEREGRHCARHQDFRRAIESDQLDAVMISTPDHNHAQIALTSMQAGLDLYLEKPLTLTIAEGRAVADAVARSGRVLQVGSQQRTMEMNVFGCEFVRDGRLGRISRVELPNYGGPMGMKTLPEESIPAGLDWDLYCGPRPLRAYNERLWVKDIFRVGNLLWRGWDLWRDYSGHMTTNWGAHSLDMVQYALGEDASGPVEIVPHRPEDVRELADEWAYSTPISEELGLGGDDARRFWPVTLRYASGVEVAFAPGRRGITFEGEHGTMAMTRNAFEVAPSELATDGPDPQVAEKWRGPGHVARPHVANWLECLGTRTTPHAPVEAGHRTNSACLLVNIARELGRPLRWDPARERFVDDAEADALLERPRREGYELPVV